MYSVVILEDDDEQADVLMRMIARSPYAAELQVLRLCDVLGLESHVEAGNQIDILLTDITLANDGPTGIDAVKQLIPDGYTQVVYVTGHIEFCTQVYQTEHICFLVKPVKQADLDETLTKALTNLRNMPACPICVRSQGTTALVQPQQIHYIESDRRKVCFHVDQVVYEEYATLKELADQLPSSFVQCHKSFLVNLDHVMEMHSNHLVLGTGEEIPVSQKKRKEVREAFFLRAQEKL